MTSPLEEARATLAQRRKKAMLRKRRKNRPKSRKRSMAAKKAHRKNRAAYKRGAKAATRTRRTSPLHHWAPLPHQALILQELENMQQAKQERGATGMVTESPAVSKIRLVMKGASPAEAFGTPEDCACPDEPRFVDPTRAQPMQDAKAEIDRLSSLSELPRPAALGPLPNVWDEPDDEEEEDDEYDDEDDEDLEDEEEEAGVDLDGDGEEGESEEHKSKVLHQEDVRGIISAVASGVSPESAFRVQESSYLDAIAGAMPSVGGAGNAILHAATQTDLGRAAQGAAGALYDVGTDALNFTAAHPYLATAGYLAAKPVVMHPYVAAAGLAGAPAAISAAHDMKRRFREKEDLERAEKMGKLGSSGFGLKHVAGAAGMVLATKLASQVADRMDPDSGQSYFGGAVRKLFLGRKKSKVGQALSDFATGTLKALTPGTKKKSGDGSSSSLGKTAVATGVVGAGLYGAHKLIQRHLEKKRRQDFLQTMNQHTPIGNHHQGAVVLASRMEDKDDPRYGMIVTEAVIAPAAQAPAAQPALDPVKEIKRHARKLAERDLHAMFGGAK